MYRKRFFLIIVIIISFNNSDKLFSQNIFQTDYSQLSVLGIEKILEIKESEEYLPGIFEDLIVVSSGELIVSDRQKTTIELFSKTGRYKGVVARKGNGPGEIVSDSFYLVASSNDSWIVQYGDSRQIDFYGMRNDGGFEYEKSWVPDQISNHRLEIIEGHQGTTYFALKKDWVDQIGLNLPDYSYVEMVVVDQAMNIIMNPSQALKTPNYLFGDSRRFSSPVYMAGLAFLGMPPYRYQDRLRKINDGFYLIARSDDSVIKIFNGEHELINEIILEIKERPVQENDMDYFLKKNLVAVDSKVREELKIKVSDVKPPFLNIWASDDYLLLHTDTSAEGKEVVLINMSGDTTGKLYLSEYDNIQYFRNNKIYTIHKSPESGHSIRVYQITIESASVDGL